MLGCSSSHQFIICRLTCPLETVCVLLLDLVVTLTKFLLVLFFSLEDTLLPSPFSFTTALSESFPWTIIRDVFSLPILTYLLFSQVRKPILDSTHIQYSHSVQDLGQVLRFRY